MVGIAACALILCTGMARAEIVVVVSSGSDVEELSRGQVADIFLGKTARFPNGRRVVPVDQPEDSAARDAFYAKFTGKSPDQIKTHWAKIIFTGRGDPPKTAANGIEARKLVLKNPNAISYMDRALIDDSVKVIAR